MRTTMDDFLNKLKTDPAVGRALAFLAADAPSVLDWQIAVTAIPAPTFHEAARAEFVRRSFVEAGLSNARLDRVGNVVGVWPGKRGGPTLAVTAHLDTVFPAGTDTRAVRKNGKILAPGIADDGRGLAVLWSLIRMLAACKPSFKGQLVFCATVGEEGLGDLRGAKAFCRTHPTLDGFISVESGAHDRIVYQALSSRRYRVTVRGPGGHSFYRFGTPSAVHALGRAIAALADLEPGATDTTFNVGTIRGGSSVNTVAAEASMDLDFRSMDPAMLVRMTTAMRRRVRQAVADENQRWQSAALSATIDLIGNRPGGMQTEEAPMVQVALAAGRALGFGPSGTPIGSTDCNAPLHRGVPAVMLGGGGRAEDCHTLAESYDPVDAHLGAQRVLLTVLALLGAPPLRKPLLACRHA